VDCREACPKFELRDPDDALDAVALSASRIAAGVPVLLSESADSSWSSTATQSPSPRSLSHQEVMALLSEVEAAIEKLSHPVPAESIAACQIIHGRLCEYKYCNETSYLLQYHPHIVDLVLAKITHPHSYVRHNALCSLLDAGIRSGGGDFEQDLLVDHALLYPHVSAIADLLRDSDIPTCEIALVVLNELPAEMLTAHAIAVASILKREDPKSQYVYPFLGKVPKS